MDLDDIGDSRVRDRRLIDKTSAWKTNLSADDIITMPVAALDIPYNRYSLPLSPHEAIVKWLPDNSLSISSITCNKSGESCVQPNARDALMAI